MTKLEEELGKENARLMDELRAEKVKRSDAEDARDRYQEAMGKLTAAMELNWGRHNEAGYAFPTNAPLTISQREGGCRVEDLLVTISNLKPYL